MTHRVCRGSTGRTCQLVAGTRTVRAGDPGSSLGVPPNMRNFVHCVRRLLFFGAGGFFDAGTQRVQRSTGTYDPAGSRYATGRNITRLYATLRNWGTQHGGTQQTPQNATIYATYATNTDANATLYASADDPGAGHGRRTQNLGRLGSNRSADGWRYADTWPPWSTAGPATTRWPGWIGGSNTQGTQLGTQLTGTRTQLAQTQHATPAQRDATNW